jgi:hypothetical protein
VWLRQRDSRIVLSDQNLGNYHDPESFAKFIGENKTA